MIEFYTFKHFMKDILRIENNEKNSTLDESSNEDNNALYAVVSLISLILHTSNQDEKTLSMLRKETFDNMKEFSNDDSKREILYNKDITFSDVISFINEISIDELAELEEGFKGQLKEVLPEYFSSIEIVCKKFEEYMAQRRKLEEQVKLLKEMKGEENSEEVYSKKNDKKMSKNKMFQMFQLREMAKLLEKVYKLYYKYLPRSNVYDNYIISNIGYMLPISSNFHLEVPPKNLTNLVKRTFTLYYNGLPYIKLNADSIVNVVESAVSGATLGIIGETPIHLVTKVPEMLTKEFHKQSLEEIKEAIPKIEIILIANSKELTKFHIEVKQKNIKYSFKECQSIESIKQKCKQNRIRLGLEF